MNQSYYEQLWTDLCSFDLFSGFIFTFEKRAFLIPFSGRGDEGHEAEINLWGGGGGSQGETEGKRCPLSPI